MTPPPSSRLGVWNYRSTFILALIGSALGLGNLWRFSWLVGEHGGAPFVVCYLIALLFVATPVLVAEVVIGSHGRSAPKIAMDRAVQWAGANGAWRLLGWLITLTALLMLSYYAVIAGWGVAYIEKMHSGSFSGASAAQAASDFNTFLSDPYQLVYWQSLFLAVVFLICLGGIRIGLGLAFWILFPALVACLLVLVSVSLEQGNIDAAQSYLFGYDPWRFDASSVLAALGHAFFTLSVGVGAGMAVGAYAPEKIPVARTVIAVALLDILFAMAAGLAIFPIVFAANVEPTGGPALIFVALPYAIGNMPDGEFYGVVFFLLVALTALGTAVAMAEALVAYFVQRFRMHRIFAVIIVAPAVWGLGLLSVLSFNEWKDGVPGLGMTAFQLIERLSADILLPLIGLLIAIFVGWVMRREVLKVEMDREDPQVFRLWRFSLRYITPTAILVVLIATVLGTL